MIAELYVEWENYSSTQMLALRSLRDTVCGQDGVTFVCRMEGSHLFKSLLCISAPSFCERSDLEEVRGTRLDRALQICTTLRVTSALCFLQMFQASRSFLSEILRADLLSCLPPV